MNAIEVLKDMIEFDGEYVPKIVLSKSKHYSDELFEKQQIALKEALLALEINESLINDLLLLANMRADDTITGNEIISCLLKNKVNIVQGKDFIWERVGEQKHE